MKIKTLAFAISALLLNSAAAHTGHSHDTVAVAAHEVIDDGAVTSELDDLHAAHVKKRMAIKKDMVRTQSASDKKRVDVVVVIHKTWIDTMSEKLTQDENGKYFENGAQFAIARVNAQFDFFNESLELQGVNLEFKPAYYAVTDHEIVPHLNVGEAFDFQSVRNCVYWPDNYLNYSDNVAYCAEQGFERIREITNAKVDLMYYVRDYVEGEAFIGHGGHLSAAAIYDRYQKIINENRADPFAVKFNYETLTSMRFGAHNASVMMHEFGHAMEAYHQVSEAEPVFPNDSNRAYECGQELNNVFPGRKRGTIMFSGRAVPNAPLHRFFSDPDIIIDGEPCGVAGEAENIVYVRRNEPLMPAIFDMAANTSDVFFVNQEITVSRTEGKAVILLRRTGDLTKPAYVNVLASDGTAWEQRDFTFGLQEVKFSPGQSEQSVEVTLLPRAEGHPDTELTVKILAAVQATFNAAPVEVTIISDKQIQNGSVGFASASQTALEGDIAQVTVSRVNGTDGDVTFNVATSNGTAVAGTDYTAVNETVTIKAGDDSASVLVTTTKRSGLQGLRTVNVTISNVTGAETAVTQSTLTISDVVEAGTVAFSASSLSAAETGSVTLTINRTGGSDGAVSVRVQTVNGTAVAGTDFTAVNQVVSFAEGQTTGTVTVTMLNREGAQGVRTFNVQMSDATGGVELGTISTAQVSVTDVSAPPAGGSGSSGGSTPIWFALSLMLLALFRKKVELKS